MKITDIQKLVDKGSKGKSGVWKHFHLISLDSMAVPHCQWVPFVKCCKCNSLLKWKSQEGTSGLTAHIDYCASQVLQTKLTAVAGFNAMIKDLW